MKDIEESIGKLVEITTTLNEFITGIIYAYHKDSNCLFISMNALVASILLLI